MPLDDNVLKKIDGGLRTLLETDDDEIVRQVEREETRIAELKRMPAGPTLGREKHPSELRQVASPRALPHPRLRAVQIDKAGPFKIRIRAIANFTGNRDDLTALGLEVKSQAQDIFTVKGTKQQLTTLAAQHATIKLRLPRLFAPTVEQASAQDEVADVHNPRPDNPNGFEGDGVIVGLYDSPIDVTHHGFQDLSGQTRLSYYWVQQPHMLDSNHNWTAENPPGQTPEQYHQTHPGSPDFTGLNCGPSVRRRGDQCRVEQHCRSVWDGHKSDLLRAGILHR